MAKHAAQWSATLNTYASPVIGKMLVRDIEAHHVREIVGPIWSTKHETATRVRNRIENVIGYAMAMGYRPKGANPAALKDNLDHALAPSAKVAKVKHHAALPVDELPAFMAKLRDAEGQGARALEFAILTAGPQRRGSRRDMGRDRFERAHVVNPRRAHEGRQAAPRRAVDRRSRAPARNAGS